MNRIFSISKLSLTAIAALLLFVASGAAAETQSVVSGAPLVSGALPDTGASVLRVFGALALVIGIFLGGVWLFRNWQRLSIQKKGAPKLNVLEAKSLGQRQAIYVVAYEQQRLLLAASPAGITLLSHLPEADGEKTVSIQPTTRMSFADAFQQVLTRK